MVLPAAQGNAGHHSHTPPARINQMHAPPEILRDVEPNRSRQWQPFGARKTGCRRGRMAREENCIKPQPVHRAAQTVLRRAHHAIRARSLGLPRRQSDTHFLMSLVSA